MNNEDKDKTARDLDALLWALFYHAHKNAIEADRALEAFQQRFPDFPEAME